MIKLSFPMSVDADLERQVYDWLEEMDEIDPGCANFGPSALDIEFRDIELANIFTLKFGKHGILQED